MWTAPSVFILPVPDAYLATVVPAELDAAYGGELPGCGALLLHPKVLGWRP